jgi:hypothetical protein
MLVLLATILTVCNCAKAIHIDDAAYVAYAAHIAEHPLAPYAFAVYWGDELQPANDLLAPPVLLYWTAAAMRCLGEQPWLWKLALWPLHVLLAFSLHALLSRFARSAVMPLVWMIMLSPALLPSTNLMLDVPALALGLTSIAVFLRGADRSSWTVALGAGFIAALAMQTKYTMLVTPAVFLAWGVTHGKVRLASLAAGVSLAVFTAWELVVYWQQGDSHFLLALQHRTGSTTARMRHLVSPLLTMTAAVTPGVLLASLYVWKRSWMWLAAAAAALVGGLLVIGTGAEAEIPLYATLAAAWWLTMTLVIFRLWQARGSRPTVVFLLLWFSVEIAGFFAMSPFPAARRVLGLAVVSTLLVGHFAWQNWAVKAGPLWFAAGISAVCGAWLAFVDLHEADAARQAAMRSAEVARGLATQGTTWFSGTWGFQFYAQRQGLEPLLPGVTWLKRGDVLVLAQQPLKRVDLHLESAPVMAQQVVVVQDHLPWQTVVCYYSGRTPLRHQEGPRIRVTVYRVLEDFVAVGQGEMPALR